MSVYILGLQIEATHDIQSPRFTCVCRCHSRATLHLDFTKLAPQKPGLCLILTVSPSEACLAPKQSSYKIE